MKISLEQIEQTVDQELYLLAENLLDQGAMTQLTEVEFNLWAGNFLIDNTELEVEIQLRGLNAINATCDCQKGKNKNLCSHIIAALLAIRKLKTKLKTSETAVPKSIDKIEKISQTAFIDELPEYAMHEFVKQYAKQDKRFLLALKVHFATQVETLKDTAAYLEILEATQKSTRRSGKKFTLQSQRDYLKVIDKLIGETKSAYQNQDWRTTFDLTFALLQSLLFNLPFTYKVKRSFLDRCRQVFAYANDLAALPLAPELEEKFLSFFLEYLEQNGIAFKFLGKELLYCARRKSTNAEEQKTLLSIVETIREETKPNEAYWGELSRCSLDLASHLGDAVLESIKGVEQISSEIYLDTFRLLEDEFAFAALLRLINFARFKFPNEQDFIAALNELELKLAIRDDETEEILRLGQLRLLESGQIRYYKMLKKASTGMSWPGLKVTLLENLSPHFESIKIQELMGEIFRLDKQPEEMLSFINAHLAMTVMREHALWLYERVGDSIKGAYGELIKQYAEQYVGPIAAKNVFHALQEIQQIFGENASASLVVELKEEHPNRHALIGSLDTLAV